jgi:hypothetical protein
MEAVSYLNNWIGYLLILTPFGAGTIVTYQAVSKSLSCDDDEIAGANKKIKQSIKGAIIIMCMSSIIEVIKAFYLT